VSVGLKLVQSDKVIRMGTGGIYPVQLVNAQLIELFWSTIRPLLDRCVREAMHGELEVDDIKQMALAGQIVIMVFTDDLTGQGNVDLAVAIEPVAYPRLPGINIIAMGGTNFGLIQKKYWTYFKGWAMMNGAKMIEASVSPAMARILRKYGYVEEYTHVRCRLMES
jgi:hypothetical protein